MVDGLETDVQMDGQTLGRLAMQRIWAENKNGVGGFAFSLFKWWMTPFSLSSFIDLSLEVSDLRVLVVSVVVTDLKDVSLS